MNKYFYDLHIHSVLSPCGDDTMTVNNIINMAKIKGLDIISITDHNCSKNSRVASILASEKGLLFVPGIEVETVEGIHVLCYFPCMEYLEIFSKIIYNSLPKFLNDAKLLGEQYILDKDDDIIGREELMLLNSTSITLNEMIKMVHDYDGIAIGAHIDKSSQSIYSVLGFIPQGLLLDGIEVINPDLIKEQDHLRYRIVKNSDAHYIGYISEKINYLELKAKTLTEFFTYFRGRS